MHGLNTLENNLAFARTSSDFGLVVTLNLGLGSSVARCTHQTFRPGLGRHESSRV